MIAALQQTCSVFLVEDEAMIRMMIVDMLEELGPHIAAGAGAITDALAMVQTTQFDLAILDVNVGGQMTFPVADVVVATNNLFGRN